MGTRTERLRQAQADAERLGERGPPPITRATEGQLAGPKSSDSRTLRGYALAAAIAAGIAVVAFGLWAALFRDTWEQDNRDKILSMCNEAAALAKTGDLTRFDAKRAAILALVGTRGVENPELKAALQRVEDAGNILVASTKREAERVGQAEAARRQAEQEKQRLEEEARLAAEEKQRQKEEAERLALEEKKRRDDAEAQRRAEEEKQRLAGEARQNADKERQRLVAEANRRAEEEKQKKEEQGGREAEAKQQAAEEQRRQQAIAALTTELGRITASLEQAKAEGRAPVQERNQLQYKYNSERLQVQQQYQTMVNEIENRRRAERRSLSPPLRPNPTALLLGPAERVEYMRQEAEYQRLYAEYQRQLAEVERRRSERLLAAEAWRTNQYREIDRRYQPQVTAIDGKIAQLAEVVKSLMQSQADLQNRLKKMRSTAGARL